jgi:hypothetical protein
LRFSRGKRRGYYEEVTTAGGCRVTSLVASDASSGVVVFAEDDVLYY